MHLSRHAFCLFVFAAILSIGVVEPAFAQALGGVERVLQNIVDALTGNVAKLLATLAVIVTGLAWMFRLSRLASGGLRHLRRCDPLRRLRDRRDPDGEVGLNGPSAPAS